MVKKSDAEDGTQQRRRMQEFFSKSKLHLVCWAQGVVTLEPTSNRLLRLLKCYALGKFPNGINCKRQKLLRPRVVIFIFIMVNEESVC